MTAGPGGPCPCPGALLADTATEHSHGRASKPQPTGGTRGPGPVIAATSEALARELSGRAGYRWASLRTGEGHGGLMPSEPSELPPACSPTMALVLTHK